jgi:hypothetical protein
LKGGRVGVGVNRVVGNRNHSKINYRHDDEHPRYDDSISYDVNDAYLIKSLLRNKRIIFVGDSLSR